MSKELLWPICLIVFLKPSSRTLQPLDTPTPYEKKVPNEFWLHNVQVGDGSAFILCSIWGVTYVLCMKLKWMTSWLGFLEDSCKFCQINVLSFLLFVLTPSDCSTISAGKGPEETVAIPRRWGPFWGVLHWGAAIGPRAVHQQVSQFSPKLVLY